MDHKLNKRPNRYPLYAQIHDAYGAQFEAILQNRITSGDLRATKTSVIEELIAKEFKRISKK